MQEIQTLGQLAVIRLSQAVRDGDVEAIKLVLQMPTLIEVKLADINDPNIVKEVYGENNHTI